MTTSSATRSVSSIDGSGSQAGVATPPKRVRAEERKYASEMMFIGQRCHWHACHREDFLPFRCADCAHHFCSEHFRTEQHACPKPAPSFVVPQCPLCHEPPRTWKRDEDPNVAMNAHLSPDPRSGRVECTAIQADGTLRQQGAATTTTSSRRANECNERRCKKIMVVPIQCPDCAMHFCPSHRAPVQHACAASSTTKQRSMVTGKAPASSMTVKQSSPGSKLLESLAAKRNAAAAPSSSASETNKNAQSRGTSVATLNPISALQAASQDRKMDKRARSEQVSAVKAMQARHRKGLLTEAEQVKLAEEMAKLQTGHNSSSGSKRDDCCIA